MLIVALQAFLLRGFLSSMEVGAPYEYLYAATGWRLAWGRRG